MDGKLLSFVGTRMNYKISYFRISFVLLILL